MPLVSFEYAAFYYLNWWLAYDRRFCAALSDQSEVVQLSGLSEAAAKYGVARTAQKKFERKVGAKRFEPILAAIRTAKPTHFEGDNLVPAVLQIARTLSATYGDRGVLSLTTKLLWLKIRHPIIIVDANARLALNRRDADLSTYYKTWRKEYEEQRTRVDAACEALVDARRFCLVPDLSPEELSKLSGADWFRERVFDIYLWHKGAPAPRSPSSSSGVAKSTAARDTPNA